LKNWKLSYLYPKLLILQNSKIILGTSHESVFRVTMFFVWQIRAFYMFLESSLKTEYIFIYFGSNIQWNIDLKLLKYLIIFSYNFSDFKSNWMHIIKWFLIFHKHIDNYFLMSKLFNNFVCIWLLMCCRIWLIRSDTTRV